MIRLVHPYNGHAPGTELPLIGRGEARLLVERGLAEFLDPTEKLPERPKAKPAAKVEPKNDDPEPTDEGAEAEPDKPADSPTSKRRGRKKSA